MGLKHFPIGRHLKSTISGLIQVLVFYILKSNTVMTKNNNNIIMKKE